MKEIKIQIRAGSKNLSNPRRFFRDIPKVLEHFRFVETKNPDFVIYYDKREVPKGNFVKIAYAREYMHINMNTCDWAIGWEYENTINSNRYIRLPNYTFHHGAGTNLIKDPEYDPEKILKQKTKFCAYVYWHKVPVRVDFFNYLNKYKKVHAPGPCCNNARPIGGFKTPLASRMSLNSWKEKVDYLKQFKFTIAFENRNSVGYTSEKIYHPMIANSIPVYYGNRLVRRDFNTNSFINAHDQNFGSQRETFEHLMRRIKVLDNDDDLYIKTLRQPWLAGNRLGVYTDSDRYFRFFAKIFNSR